MRKAAIEIFGGAESLDSTKVFFCAHRYVQGPGVLEDIDTYLPMVGGRVPGLLLPGDLPTAIGETVEAAFATADIAAVRSPFGGQCSFEEIDSQVATFRAAAIDVLVAIGGGKVIDAAKCIARRINVPLIVCPTLASTDAPCSAAAVVYTAEGAFRDVEFLPSNPDLVVVDTAIIAKAPVRFLLAGMADALATGYEARTCVANAAARSMVGGRITIAAATIAEICSRTIFEHADNAVAAVKSGILNESFERVVEANTLLSGIGFESGGLAAAHAVASALTLVPSIEHRFLHGEMVAVGTMIHLQLEGDGAELERVDTLLARLGLPRALSDLGITAQDGDGTFVMLVEAACNFPFMKNGPFEVTPDILKKAIFEVEERRMSSAQYAA